MAERPFKIPNVAPQLPDPPDSGFVWRFPDADGNGIVDPNDASVILNAYTAKINGQDTGLTPDQLLRCDANMDGKIDPSDASLVISFYANVSVHNFTNNLAGWNAFMRREYPDGSPETGGVRCIL